MDQSVSTYVDVLIPPPDVTDELPSVVDLDGALHLAMWLEPLTPAPAFFAFLDGLGGLVFVARPHLAPGHQAWSHLSEWWVRLVDVASRVGAERAVVVVPHTEPHALPTEAMLASWRSLHRCARGTAVRLDDLIAFGPEHVASLGVVTGMVAPDWDGWCSPM